MNESKHSFARAGMIYQLGRVVCRVGTTLLFDLKVYGVRHVPRHGGVLLLSNHQSYLDPACVAVKIPRPVSFLAKSELFETPVLGWLIRKLHAFPVRQGAGDIHAVREMINRVSEGHILTVFAEGSRTSDGKMLPLQPGFALVVRKSGVPVVPVVIDGSWDAWRRGKWIFTPHPIKVLFGPPLAVQGLKPTEITKLGEKTLHEMMARLKSGDLSNA